MMRSSSSTTSHSTFDFKKYLEDRRVLVEAKLDELLTEEEPEILWESMRYSALGAGKRIRALLSIASYETIKRLNAGGECGAKLKCDSESTGEKLAKYLAPVLPVACAIEMVHAMSLVHDDLPCLDNDDVRRGKPTNHKTYGEAMALLAGDALLMRAIEILICSRADQVDIGCDQSMLDKSILDITRGLAAATGAGGMVGGQVFDLVYTGSGTPMSESENQASAPEKSLEINEKGLSENNPREQNSLDQSHALPLDQSRESSADRLSSDGKGLKTEGCGNHSPASTNASQRGTEISSKSIEVDQSNKKGKDQLSSAPSNAVAFPTGAASKPRAMHLDEAVIRKIHAGKTGALLRFSLWSGARLAQASAEQLAALEQFGDIVGLAFQITDDLLDVTGDVETLGKTPGKDQAANKATWVSVFGVEGAREKLHVLEDEGKRLLQAKGLACADEPILESLLAMAIHRRK